MHYPPLTTKRYSVSDTFDLTQPADRVRYFKAKAGTEIEDIKTYLETNTFVAFLLAKKQAGKGTYAKMLIDILGPERVEHISVGDLVRETDDINSDPAKKEELFEYMRQHYRGFMNLEEAFDAFVHRSTATLLPTEFILALIKRHISSMPHKAFLIDGFPRSLDQVSYSLYFREIMNLRPDPDFFVFFDIPMEGIDERMKSRVVCPLCKTSRNRRFMLTPYLEYDADTDTCHLLCDNKSCAGFKKERLVTKEGDSQGAQAIAERLENEGTLMEAASNLQGVPSIAVCPFPPVSDTQTCVDEYELTTSYTLTGTSDGTCSFSGAPWVLHNDSGDEVHSVVAPAALVFFLYELHSLLGLDEHPN